MDLRECIPGLIVLATGGRSVFKLAVVLEQSTRVPGKVRVCVWSAASQTWSNPQCVKPTELEVVPESLENPRNEEWSRRRRVLMIAMKAIDDRNGWVRSSSGQWKVTSVRTKPPRPKDPTEGVTTLAPIAGTVSDKGVLIVRESVFPLSIRGCP
jgi:hypothetical protein